MNINRVVLIGRLTRDPELRTTQGGTDVCEFSLAINSRRKQGEEWVDHAEFFDVVVYDGQAESCATYLAKGSMAGVEGKLRQERWEKDGQKRSRVRVQATSVQFLTRSDGDDSSPHADSSYPDDDFQF